MREKKNRKISLRLTHSQYDALEQTAEEYEDRTVAWLATKYILDGLNNDPKRPIKKPKS